MCHIANVRSTNLLGNESDMSSHIDAGLIGPILRAIVIENPTEFSGRGQVQMKHLQVGGAIFNILTTKIIVLVE